MRVALEISYNGSDYHGWQSQPGGISSVQDEVQSALGVVAAKPIKLTCAGRTDTGVHALGQVVHFDTDVQRPVHAWIKGTNALLSRSIVVNWSAIVPDTFDARFSAVSRRYFYLIEVSTVRNALLPTLVTRDYRQLDAGSMHLAAQALVGEHDFSSFRSSVCQSRTPMRNIQRIAVSRLGSLIVIDVTANAFLHHMVRNIAGVLMDIGAGLRGSAWAGELLALRDRTRGSVTAPPHGLYLARVEYPSSAGVDRPVYRPHLFGLLPV